jgi:hypothetical protein
VIGLNVPKDWDELTPEWMTAVMARHHSDAVVDTVAVQLRDDGTNRRARLALTYSQVRGRPRSSRKPLTPLIGT